jgi:hypothetical protein
VTALSSTQRAYRAAADSGSNIRDGEGQTMSHSTQPETRITRITLDKLTRKRASLLAATIAVAIGFGATDSASAAGPSATDKKIAQMQAQIDELQRELQEMKAAQTQVAHDTAQAQQTAQVAQETAAKAAEKKVADNKKAMMWDGPIALTLGGFVDMTLAYRNRNMVSDIATSYNAIPFPSSVNHRITEFRPSARQSRLSLLAQGPSNGHESVEAYFEGDFFGAAPTANSGESNSYTPRMRQAYAAYTNKDTGLYLLAGQAWSLATLSKSANMYARNEVIPVGMDAQYVVGFNWTRAPQIRLVEKFNDQVSGAVSFEGPQTSFFAGPNAPLNPTLTTNPGGTLFAPTSNYSLDVAPDVIGKLSFDPAFGHFEALGVGRWFRSRVALDDKTTMSGGFGAGFFAPVVPKLLDLSATVMTGKGIGRYASGQLPDVTIKPDGSLQPIKETTAMLGLVGHVTPTLDLFGYVGTERESRADYTVVSGGKTLAYGYGNPLYSNAGCKIDALPGQSPTCTANTKQLSEIALGGYWKFYKGDIGTMQAGLQFEHVKRETFDGVGGAPSTDLNVLFFSLRFFPFQ